MAETAEQQELLTQIEQETATLALYQDKVKQSRTKQWKLMVAAKELHTSSYAISRAAGISQPRVMQIIKEVRDARSSEPVPLGPVVDTTVDSEPPADPAEPGSAAQLPD